MPLHALSDNIPLHALSDNMPLHALSDNIPLYIGHMLAQNHTIDIHVRDSTVLNVYRLKQCNQCNQTIKSDM